MVIVGALISLALSGVTALFKGAAARGAGLQEMYQFWNPLFGEDNWPEEFEKWIFGRHHRRNWTRAINLTIDLVDKKKVGIWNEFIDVAVGRLPQRNVCEIYFGGVPQQVHWQNDGCLVGDDGTHYPVPYDPNDPNNIPVNNGISSNNPVSPLGTSGGTSITTPDYAGAELQTSLLPQDDGNSLFGGSGIPSWLLPIAIIAIAYKSFK